MHSISYFWHLSRLIYGPRNFQENKRAVVFFARAVSNRALFEELYDFFDHYEPMKGSLIAWTTSAMSRALLGPTG